MKSSEIRQKFLSFFKDKNHKIVASAPMVRKNDPSLMFTNAGMNQFKDNFLNVSNAEAPRVTDTQKCLRVSGKHNDLEEVGVDTYHHTMFEMLGNWSFGDYFKEEAIQWSWELLTEVYKIDPDNLYVTVFEGYDSDGLKRDDESAQIWAKLIDSDRILNGNKKDNFWEMGDQGPCGPCSEIHVDLRSADEKQKVDGKSLVNQDHPQVVEIWNLVFIQYDRKADGSLEDLPAQHVDTGMGLERLAMVLQGKQSNYDTDVFRPLIKEIETITNNQYGKEKNTDVAIRVVADHLRAVAFSIADGQLPSNTGAGYVIRRILRRAVRYAFTFLNRKEPFIYLLVDVLIQQMGKQFPELTSQKSLIQNVIKEEEASFLRTLEQGQSLLDTMIQRLRNNNEDTLKGQHVFELYDTYGFPKDLTALILRENNLKIDESGFEAAMEQQKKRARKASESSTGDWQVLMDDDIQEFVGYDRLSSPVRITKYRKVESKKEGERYQLVFNLTPFYGESGGQTGDKGYLEAPDGEVVYIIDTKKENNQTVHITKNLPKHPEQRFTAVVDKRQRARTAANHTATHLLHQALRSILGSHVEQKGSMVRSASLRFDFSHFSKVTEEELQQIEDFVNARIEENLQLEENRSQNYDEAIADGAIGLFGEKYGDVVRTIKFGNSYELCGGTHVPSTQDLWHFKITSETAVAAGIRRIEAITGETAKDYFTQQSANYEAVQNTLNTKDALKAIESLQSEVQQLRKETESLKQAQGAQVKDKLLNQVEQVNDVHLIAAQVDMDAKSMKDLAFALDREKSDLVALLGSEQNGKALLTLIIDKNLTTKKGLDASKIIRDLAKNIKGGGGGQKYFATAGGKDFAGFEACKSQLVEMLNDS